LVRLTLQFQPLSAQTMAYALAEPA
jgi:hypothetical protein